MPTLRLKHKLLALVLIMGLVPFAGALFIHTAHDEQMREDARALRVQQGLADVEKINQLVYAVVAESRGIYLAQSWEEARPFAEALLSFLKEIDARTAGLAAVSDGDQALIDETRRTAAIFIRMRQDLVASARDVSLSVGRTIGDTAETRRFRKGFNAVLLKLSDAYARQSQLSRQQADRARARVQTAVFVSAAVPLAGIVCALAIVSLGLTRPIEGIRGSILALAEGRLQGPVFGEDRKDEIGDIAQAVGVFRDKLAESARERAAAEAERLVSAERHRVAQQQAVDQERALVERSIGAGLARLAQKDLTYRLQDDLPECYRRLRHDFNSAMDVLEEALAGVRGRGTTIAATTQEISSSADELSRHTEQQAAGLEQTAAAIDEITATGKKSAEGAIHARDVVAAARRDAEGTGDVVRQTVAAMGSIEKSSQQIGQIIGVIDEIAFQTNLLALNAGVEAARAGEAGRGFAVVASEVRALAQRSANAAKEIKSLIATSTSQVSAGVELVDVAGKALQRILDRFGEINHAVADIASAAQEQATGLAEINTTINGMDQMTQQNASMAEETTAASHTLAAEANELSQLVTQFKVRGSAGLVDGAGRVARADARTHPGRDGVAIAVHEKSRARRRA